MTYAARRPWVPSRAQFVRWVGAAMLSAAAGARASASTDVSIRVVGAARSRRLNARDRRKDQPTNVLSFAGAGVAPDGRRLDRHGAARIVRRVTRRAGITKKVGPHTLRHAFITAALDAGVPLRDVQEAASHADPRTTMRYDRARTSLDRHATYIVATYVAGAAR